MASKLFRAVVGFGIALGAASAACLGTTDDAGVTTEEPDASTPTTDSPSSSSSSSGDPDPTPDASRAKDAGLDAPKDVGADAFCDAAWPTTKGNPKPPSCVDPNGDCADAGPPEHCYGLGDAGACDFAKMTFPYCVNENWQCQPGTTTGQGCK